MANILGVNIETPQEAQQRLLREQMEGLKSMRTTEQQLGFNFGMAIAAAVGHLDKSDDEREAAVEEARREADVAFVNGQIDQQREQNARLIRRDMQARGAPEEEIQLAITDLDQNIAAQKERVAAEATGQAVEEHKNRFIAQGADPVDADIHARAFAATKLRKLGGAENIRLANQMSTLNTQAIAERRIRQQERDRLLAEEQREIEAHEADMAESVFDNMTPLERQQTRREELTAELRGVPEGSPEAARIQQQIDEVDAAIFKATGTSPSAATIKSFGAARGAVQSVVRTGEVFETAFTNDEGELTVNPEKAAVIGTAMNVMSDGLLKLSAGADVLGMDDISDAIDSMQRDFITNLVDAAGMSQADAIRVYQEVRGAVIAQARSFGGPITESDLEQAMAASGVSSGRLDVFYEKQVQLAEQGLATLRDQAEIEGSLRSGSPLIAKIREQEEDLARMRQLSERFIQSGMFEFGVGGTATPTSKTERKDEQPTKPTIGIPTPRS